MRTDYIRAYQCPLTLTGWCRWQCLALWLLETWIPEPELQVTSESLVQPRRWESCPKPQRDHRTPSPPPFHVPSTHMRGRSGPAPENWAPRSTHMGWPLVPDRQLQKRADFQLLGEESIPDGSDQLCQRCWKNKDERTLNGWKQTFSVKDWIVNIFSLVGHTVSITTTQLCPGGTVIDSRWMCQYNFIYRHGMLNVTSLHVSENNVLFIFLKNS